MKTRQNIYIKDETVDYIHYKKKACGVSIGWYIDSIVQKEADNDSEYQQYKKDSKKDK